MRILVTGGAGFIGSHVVDALLAAGHLVWVVDDLSTGRADNVDPAATLIVRDLRQPGLGALLAELRPEQVLHLAARVEAHARPAADPRPDAEVNLLAGLDLLAAARRAGVRKVIFGSSAAVYGEPRRLPVDEDHSTWPLSDYGVAKLAFEHYLRVGAAAGGPAFTILRLPNVYGPRQSGEAEAGVVAIFIRRMLAGQPCTIFGDGQQSRDFVYVTDVAAAFMAALEMPADGALWNLGSGEAVTVLTIFQHLALSCHHSLPPVLQPARPEIRAIAMSAERIAAAMGWRPTVDLQEGLERTVAWFRQMAPEPA